MGISLVEAELPGNLAAIEKDLTEAVHQSSLARQASTKTQQQPREEVVDEPVSQRVNDDRLPVKLRGKTLEEVAELYANLESAYGRMANDLGTQRKITDRILDLKREEDLSRNSPPSRVEINSQELLDNPTEAIDRAVSARIKALESENAQRLAQLEGQVARDKFIAKHADYNEVANDPQFVAWLQKSPYRTRAASAAYNGDWAAADELLTDYKEVRGKTVVTQQKEREVVQDDDNVAAARQAALESGTSPDSASKKGGKIYRRADLMLLRERNQDLYYDPEFQKEIILAYKEKRVK